MTLAEAQEGLVAWGSAEPRQGWILAARRDYFARRGEPHEEDPSFEARMNGLLDFFAYDFRPDGASTTLELYLRDGAAPLSPEARAALVDLSLGVHALFEVRRIRPGEIRVRDVFAEDDLLAQVDLAQEVDARHHALEVGALDVQLLRLVGAAADEHGGKPFFCQFVNVGHR